MNDLKWKQFSKEKEQLVDVCFYWGMVEGCLLFGWDEIFISLLSLFFEGVDIFFFIKSCFVWGHESQIPVESTTNLR